MLPVAAWWAPRDVRANARRLAFGAAAVAAVGVVLVLAVAPGRDQADRSWGRLVRAPTPVRPPSARISTSGTSRSTSRATTRSSARARRPIPTCSRATSTDPVLPRRRALEYRIESPHNVYLGIAAGAGVPALAAYLALLAGFGVVLVRGAAGARRRPTGAGSSARS